MASIEKRCRHPRAEWSECGCTWYIRRRVQGETKYARVGPDRSAAERALEMLLEEGLTPEQAQIRALTAEVERLRAELERTLSP